MFLLQESGSYPEDRSRSFERVVEAAVATALGMIAGGYSLFQALHRRVSTVDNRLDKIELLLARDYVTRAEYLATQAKLEGHMIRIEEKLDRILMERKPGSSE